MPAPYAGGCTCGAIRYRLNDEPLTLYACHCTDCQRQAGTSFVLSMFARRADLELLAGEPRLYDATLPDGRRRRGRYCEVCVTRLWGEPARFPEVVVLRPGTLDDTTWVHPVAHIWTRSAQPWLVLPPDAVRFETQPDDPRTLVHLWRERQNRRG